MELNSHGRIVAFKRQRYWICKRLHINIYENKKVCTNWVRRILMTEVAYDIIKTFRSSNESFRYAKLESYIQWLMRKSSKKSIILNYFRSKVNNAFYFKTNSFDTYTTIQSSWLNIVKYRLDYKNKVAFDLKFKSKDRTIRSKQKYSKGNYYTSTVENMYRKKLLKHINTRSKVNRLNRRSNTFSDYWYRGVLPYSGSFKIRSFDDTTYKWKVSNAINSHTHNIIYKSKYGKRKGYKYIKYSHGNMKNTVFRNVILSKRNIHNRIYFRLTVLKLLLNILYTCNNLNILYNFLYSITTEEYSNNRSLITMLLNLISKFNKYRLLNLIRLIRKMNIYDYRYVLTYSKYSNVGGVFTKYVTNNKYFRMKDYRKFFTVSNNYKWIAPWVYHSSIKGSSSIVNSVSTSYQCILSNKQYEDFTIVYNLHLYTKCFSSIDVPYKHYYKFIKWYYLFLIRDKYMLYPSQKFYSMDKNRRILMRHLYYLQNNITYVPCAYVNLVKYMCEGTIYNSLYIFNFKELNIYNGTLIKIYSGRYYYPMSNYSNTEDLLEKYKSHYKGRSYMINIVDYHDIFKLIYFKYYSVFSELRNRYIYYNILYSLNFFSHYDLLLFYSIGSKYHIEVGTPKYYINNAFYSNYYFGQFCSGEVLYKNYNILYSIFDYSICAKDMYFSENAKSNILKICNFLSFNYSEILQKDTQFYSKGKFKNLFLNKFFHSSFFTTGLLYLILHILNTTDTLVCSTEIYIGFGEYTYLNRKKNIKYRKGLRGSYMVRSKKTISNVLLNISTVDTIYYMFFNMYFSLFLYRIQDFYGHSGSSKLFNWYTFISSIYLRLKNVYEYIDDYEINIDSYEVKKVPDNELYYSFKFFKYLSSTIKTWINFRKVPLYIKYKEYFFFIPTPIYNISNSYVRRDKGIYSRYKYGYTGHSTRLFKNYIMNTRGINKFVSLKKLYNSNLFFKGYGSIDTLIFWTEASLSVTSILDYSSYLDMFQGQSLYDNRYLEEARYYNRLYRISNSRYDDYMKFLDININKYKYKVRNIIRSRIVDFKQLYQVIEDKVRIGPELFETYLDYGILDTEVNYTIAKIFSTFVHFNTQASFKFPIINFTHSILDYEHSNNLYMWSLFKSNYFFYDKYPHRILNTISKLNIGRKYNNQCYNEVLYSMVDISSIRCASFDLHISGYATRVPILNNIFLHILYFMRYQYVKSVSYLVKYRNISTKLIFSGLSSRFNHRYAVDLYLHNKLMYSDFIESSFWYVSLLKILIISCYKVYLKVYYIWTYIYKIFVKYPKRRPIVYYKYWLKNYILMCTFGNSPQSMNIIFCTNLYIKYFKFHISTAILITYWLKYWFTFFKSSSALGINLNYKLICNYLINIRSLGYNKYIKKYSLSITLRDNLYYTIEHRLVSDMAMIKLYDTLFSPFSTYICYNNYVSTYVLYKLLYLNNIIYNILYLPASVSLLLNIFYKFIDKIRYWFSILRDYIYNYKVLNQLNIRHSSGSIYYVNKYLYIFRSILYSIKYVNEAIGMFDNMYTYSIKNILKMSKRKIQPYLYKYYKQKKFIVKTLYKFFTPYITNLLFVCSSYSVSISNLRYNNCSKYISHPLSLKFVKWIHNTFTDGLKSINVGIPSISMINMSRSYSGYINDTIKIDDVVISTTTFTYTQYTLMFEDTPLNIELDNIQLWFIYHYMVRFDTRRYYSKFWYRYLPEDIVHIQRYRRFQQELRRLIGNRKCLRSGIIYRRLLLFKLIPGVSKEWHRLHVRRPYIREQFEDRVRFFYILKSKYNISRKRLLASLYSRFTSPHTMHKAYHLLYFRLDNILYKLSFIPTFTYLKGNWITQFWNISINNISDVSYVQRSLIIGDIFYIKSDLHVLAVQYRYYFHYENNLYLVYILWLRLHNRDSLPIYLNLPSEDLHIIIGRTYIWYWYRFFKYNEFESVLSIFDMAYFEYKLRYYGFWAHNFLKYKDFKIYMVISSLDSHVRWFSKAMCGFVYKEPVGFLNGLHYSSYYSREGGSYGGHIRHSSIYK